MSGREDLRAYEAQRPRDANHSGETEESGDNVVRLKQGDFPPHTSLPPHSQRRFPEPLGEAAYWGLAGRIAREIELTVRPTRPHFSSRHFSCTGTRWVVGRISVPGTRCIQPTSSWP